jgi:uncharacterized GH25 family protein
MTTERELITWAGSLRLSPSPQVDARILAAAGAAIDRNLTSIPLWKAFVNKSIAKLAVTAVALIGIIVLARHMVGTPAQSNRSTPSAVTTNLPQESNHATATSINQAEQLALAEQRFNKKDVDGLIDLLENGQDQTQVKVAGYLAELGARQAVPALQRLAAAWTGDPNANPFSQAIDRLKASGQEPNGTSKEKETTKAVASPASRVLRFRFQVVDKVTGQPLPDALIHSTVENEMYACDTNGYLQVDLVDSDRRLDSDRRFEFSVTRPGYVGMRMVFQDPNEEVLSKTHLIALEPGTLVGGIVQDAIGRPIEGAAVRFIVRLNRNDYPMEPNVCVDSEQKTDASGRWRCNAAPADLLGLVGVRVGSWEIYIGVQHVDYCYQGSSVEGTSLVQALRDQSFRTTLYEGLTFRGRIVIVNDKPIAGAQVNGCTTGPNGTFAISHLQLETRDIDLEIRANGYPMTWRRIECPPDMREVQIVLGPSWLHGHVVDERGRPVAGVSVHIFFGESRYVETNADGSFAFGGDPVDPKVDPVSVLFQKQGFNLVALAHQRSTDETLEVVLHKSLVASGQVIDAMTGQPIEQFRIRRGVVSSHDGRIVVDWNRRALPGQKGHYQCDFGYQGDLACFYLSSSDQLVVIVEADGYLPAESRSIAQDENEPIVDLTLTPGTGPNGTVVDVTGLPLTKATVYAIRSGIIYNGFIHSDSREVKAVTGPDGRFSFEPMYQLRHIVALAEQGICGTTVEELERTKVLMLQPWGEVHGTMHTTSGTPAKNQPVWIESLPDAAEHFGYTWGLSTTTDDQGTFQIQRVPPGGFTHLGKTYQVAPGQVLNLDLTVDPNGTTNPGVGL